MITPGARPAADPPDSRHTLEMLATAILVTLTVATLYFAREILVPVAIAVLLSFVLSPLVKALRKVGVGKRISVGIVVFTTFVIAVALGIVLARQVTQLATDAPQYQLAVSRKIEAARKLATSNPLLTKIDRAVSDFTQLSARSRKSESKARSIDASEPQMAGTPTGKAPLAVELVSPPPDALALLRTAVGVAATPTATAAFVAIFIVFILLQREDLRNRLIRLFGSSDLQRTTLAMNDAARRLSRYFLAQVLLNMTFGAVVALVLTLLGVPSAILWGIAAAFLRFIPYVGALAAAFFPTLMAAASQPNWTLAFETAAFFFVFELIVGQIIEPLVYGHHTGLSPIAVVISATFWTWLWGPVGLVLATPITVCVVVLGRHVNRLSFLDILLGDTPALNDVELFYQRMLSGDPSEVLDHADAYLATRSMLEYGDEIALKALLMAQEDVRRGVLDEHRQGRIRDTMQDFADVLGDRDTGQATSASEAAADPATMDAMTVPASIDPAWAEPGAVLCFAGRTPLDEAAALLLTNLLVERGIGARVEPTDRLAGSAAATLDASHAKLLILSFLDADLSLAQARFAIRRLRRRVPQVPLLAALWRGDTDDSRTAAICSSVRAEHCTSTLADALRFCFEQAKDPSCETPSGGGEAGTSDRQSEDAA